MDAAKRFLLDIYQKSDQFTEEEEVNLAINSTKHLGPISSAYITRLMNLSMSTLSIPSLWIIGRFIPILKPNKSPDQSTSYRPIYLLSPLAKLMEKLVLGTHTEHLQLADHQHGFRRMHSTTTALHAIHDHIQSGLNEKRPNKRTVMVALHLSRAFDTVNIGILMKIILETTLPPTIKSQDEHPEVSCWKQLG